MMATMLWSLLVALLAVSLVTEAVALLAYLLLVRHPNRRYRAVPGLILALAGGLLWLAAPPVLPPAYWFSLVFFGLVAALLMPWVPAPSPSTSAS